MEKPKEILGLEKFYGINIPESNYSYENEKLIKLEFETFYTTRNMDISVLASFESLKELSITGYVIENLKPLKSLCNLEYLRLSNAKIKFIEELQYLTNLKTLDLSNNYIKDLSILDTLNNLTELNLSHNRIVKIHNLSKLHELTKLNLGFNNIEKIDSLSFLFNLKDIDLSTNFVINEKPLLMLTELERVNLSGNSLVEINSLRQLNKLKYLNLSHNRVRINSLNKLPDSLVWLYLTGNKIDNVEIILESKNLMKLDLSFNNIKNTEFLINLVNLKYLELNDNDIEDISSLSELTELIELNLKNNNLKSITDKIYKLDKLLEMNLEQNPLIDLPIELCKLKKLRRLKIDYDSLLDDSLFKQYSLAEIRKIYEYDTNTSISLIQIPELLQTSFQKYLSFFDEFVKRKTNNEKEISFSTKKIKDAIEMTVVLKNNITPQEVDGLLKEYIDYIDPKKITETEIRLKTLEQENPILKLEIDMLKRQFENDIITKQQIAVLENKFGDREKMDHEIKLKMLDVIKHIGAANIEKNFVINNNLDNNAHQQAQLTTSIDFRNEFKGNKDLDELKEKLEELRWHQEFNRKENEKYIELVMQGIDAIIELQNANTSTEVTQPKSKAREIFNQLKDVKDAAAISFLLVDIQEKLPKLIDILS